MRSFYISLMSAVVFANHLGGDHGHDVYDKISGFFDKHIPVACNNDLNNNGPINNLLDSLCDEFKYCEIKGFDGINERKYSQKSHDHCLNKNEYIKYIKTEYRGKYKDAKYSIDINEDFDHDKYISLTAHWTLTQMDGCTITSTEKIEIYSKDDGTITKVISEVLDYNDDCSSKQQDGYKAEYNDNKRSDTKYGPKIVTAHIPVPLRPVQPILPDQPVRKYENVETGLQIYDPLDGGYMEVTNTYEISQIEQDIDMLGDEIRSEYSSSSDQTISLTTAWSLSLSSNKIRYRCLLTFTGQQAEAEEYSDADGSYLPPIGTVGPSLAYVYIQYDVVTSSSSYKPYQPEPNPKPSPRYNNYIPEGNAGYTANMPQSYNENDVYHKIQEFFDKHTAVACNNDINNNGPINNLLDSLCDEFSYCEIKGFDFMDERKYSQKSHDNCLNKDEYIKYAKTEYGGKYKDAKYSIDINEDFDHHKYLSLTIHWTLTQRDGCTITSTEKWQIYSKDDGTITKVIAEILDYNDDCSSTQHGYNVEYNDNKRGATKYGPKIDTPPIPVPFRPIQPYQPEPNSVYKPYKPEEVVPSSYGSNNPQPQPSDVYKAYKAEEEQEGGLNKYSDYKPYIPEPEAKAKKPVNNLILKEREYKVKEFYGAGFECRLKSNYGNNDIIEKFLKYLSDDVSFCVDRTTLKNGVEYDTCFKTKDEIADEMSRAYSDDNESIDYDVSILSNDGNLIKSKCSSEKVKSSGCRVIKEEYSSCSFDDKGLIKAFKVERSNKRTVCDDDGY